MHIDHKKFLVKPGTSVNLRDRPTRIDHYYDSKEEYQLVLTEHIRQLSAQQNILYGQNQHAILLIFQGMDTSGKDSAIKHIMSGVNPQGCQVTSFKHPSAEELQHDFLWRTTRYLPERGRIGIFNRSYYEEVLIVRVHQNILHAENVPPSKDAGDLWKGRFKSIIDLESHLYRNGTTIIKFFLHLSKKEQKKRLIERIDEEDKNWKFSADDIGERNKWKEYMSAYEKCLSATSTVEAPWYIIPADGKNNLRLIISRIIVDTIAGLDPHMPKISAEQRKELARIRRSLLRS